MNAFLPVAAAFAVAVVLGAGYFCWLPRLTRPELYFAITVPAVFRDSEEGRAILRRFRGQVLFASLVAAALVTAGGWRSSMALLTAGVGVQVAGFFAAYFAARRRVRPNAEEPSAVREAALSPSAQRLPGGWLLQAGPLVILGLAAIYLSRRWNDIPARFPNHWGLDGKPNGWAARTLGGVYGPLLQAALVCAMLTLIGYGVLRRSRPVRREGAPAQAESHFRRVVVGVLLATEYLLALVFGWAALLPLAPGPPNFAAIAGLPLAFAVVVSIILIRQGQGGARRLQGAELASQEARPVGDRTADRYWKAGMFYVNRDDPALFVEKRFGIGYTLNFGHQATWLILGALLLLPALVGLLEALSAR